MEQLKSLVKSRARLKSNITRVLAWAEQTEISTHTEIVTLIDLLNEVWKEVNQFSDCIALHEEVKGYVDPEIDNAVYEAKYLKASAILKERNNDLQLGTSTSSANGSNGHGLQQCLGTAEGKIQWSTTHCKLVFFIVYEPANNYKDRCNSSTEGFGRSKRNCSWIGCGESYGQGDCAQHGDRFTISRGIFQVTRFSLRVTRSE